MNQGSKKVVWWLVLAVVVLVGIYFIRSSNNTPGKLDGFTTCLKDSGAVFYGAFWCSHCQNQKTMFGSSKKLLPYVECSTPDSRGQTPECIVKNVDSYPTWEFKDGSRLSGEIALKTLAEKTGCVLPE